MIFRVPKPSSMCLVRFSTWAVHELPARKPACSGIKFDNGRQAVVYQALVQLVEVTQNGTIGLKLFGFEWSFPGFRRATTRACLQSLGKRCVLAHALSRLSTHCIVTGPKFLISSVRILSSPAAFPFFRCEFCISMIVKSSSMSWFHWLHRLILLCRCLFGT